MSDHGNKVARRLLLDRCDWSAIERSAKTYGLAAEELAAELIRRAVGVDDQAHAAADLARARFVAAAERALERRLCSECDREVSPGGVTCGRPECLDMLSLREGVRARLVERVREQIARDPEAYANERKLGVVVDRIARRRG